jgi:predicted acyl esterase
MTDHLITITLTKGRKIRVKVEGREGYAFIGNPSEGSPFITMNDTDQAQNEESRLLTKPSIIIPEDVTL